jgi:ribonucleoside-diphosphate reductase alpha chain
VNVANGSNGHDHDHRNGNGHNGKNGKNGKNGSHEHSLEELVAIAQSQTAQSTAVPVNDGGLSEQLSQMMGDAPFCDICGHITVRNGGCYKCLNCGNSLGCS